MLCELVKWAQIERDARDRREHSVAREAGRRMREVVQVLGFDPLEYEIGRDAAGMILNRRSREIMRHIPGSSAEIAKATGLLQKDLHAYLRPFITRGEIRCVRDGRGYQWEVVE